MDKNQKRHEQIEKIVKVMPVLIVVVAILYLVLFYLLILKPKLGRIIEGGEYDTTPVELVLESETAYQTSLKGHVERMSKISDAYRDTVTNMVTVGVDYPGLMVTLDEMTRKHHMILNGLDVNIAEAPASGGRKVVRGVANISGGDYKIMKAFLRDLERSRRIMDVQDLQFNPSGAAFSITFWAYYIDEPVSG